MVDCRAGEKPASCRAEVSRRGYRKNAGGFDSRPDTVFFFANCFGFLKRKIIMTNECNDVPEGLVDLLPDFITNPIANIFGGLKENVAKQIQLFLIGKIDASRDDIKSWIEAIGETGHELYRTFVVENVDVIIDLLFEKLGLFVVPENPPGCNGDGHCDGLAYTEDRYVCVQKLAAADDSSDDKPANALMIIGLIVSILVQYGPSFAEWLKKRRQA